MRRIATIGAVITAFAVAPSLAVGANEPANAKPQLTAQVVGVHTSRVQRAQAALSVQRAQAALSVQRHLVLIARSQGFSTLIRTQIR